MTKSRSVNLQKCAPLAASDSDQSATADKAPHALPDGVDDQFAAATQGLPPDAVEFLRDVAAHAGEIGTFAELSRYADELHDVEAGARLGRVLASIERERDRPMRNVKVDTVDLLRAAVTLLIPSTPIERDELVAACLAYARATGGECLNRVGQELMGTTPGEVLRHRLRLTHDTPATCARRAGVSRVAFFKMQRRIGQRLAARVNKNASSQA